MTQRSPTTRFCTFCGTEVEYAQLRCKICGKDIKVDERYKSRDDTIIEKKSQDPEATVKVEPVDPDATIRAGARLSVRLYRQAVQYQDLALSAAQQTEPLSVQLPLITRRQAKAAHTRKRLTKRTLVMMVCSLLLLLALLIPGADILDHGHYADAQRQAQRVGIQLERQLQHARATGVPAALLQPLILQKQQLSSSGFLLTRFPNAAGTSIYQHRVQGYLRVEQQIPGVITTARQQLESRAQWDLQDFQTALGQVTLQPVGNVQFFSRQFSQDQVLMASAQTPGAYAGISQNARQSIAALALLSTTNKQLTDFHTTLSDMQAGQQDVSAMQTQYQDDVTAFNSAVSAKDFKDLQSRIAAQYQQLLVMSTKSFPYVSALELNELTVQIQTLQSYGMDATKYQKRLGADQAASQNARSINDELTFFKQTQADLASMQGDLVHGQAHALVAQFHQEVNSWAQAHPYRDPQDGQSYAIDSGYMSQGIGALVDSDLTHATTLADTQAVITETQNAIFNLHTLEADSSDTTPFDQPHATDLQMLSHYQLQRQEVLMVSLVEQAMRVYQNGQLIRAYQVTTGRQELPSLPGVWSVLDRKSPIVFISNDPESSPYWFPPTPISYAIMYHYGGYYVHDAPWRGSFGPGTEFPHQDGSGTTRYNFDGSHGCVNLPESATAWIYSNTDWNTRIVIY